MRKIQDLLDKDGDINPDKMSEVLFTYEKKFHGWKKHLALNSKNIQDALVEQSSLAAYYDEMKVELSILMEHIDIIIARRSGEVNMMFKENSRFDHSDASVRLLIGKDPKIIEYKRFRLDVKEIHDRVSSVCNQFDKRGFDLTNITKILIAGLNDVTLTPEDESRY